MKSTERSIDGGDSRIPAKLAILSDKVLLAILDALSLHPGLETGGVLLGYRRGGIFFAMECVDPGLHSIHRRDYYEYDREYVDHCANRYSRLYKHPLKEIGIWHRHPGSMDVFSAIDDRTNQAFAAMSSSGSLSALINIDPDVRLTMYSVITDGARVRYRKIKCLIGDNHIPPSLFELSEPDEWIRRIEMREALERPSWMGEGISGARRSRAGAACLEGAAPSPPGSVVLKERETDLRFRDMVKMSQYRLPEAESPDKGNLILSLEDSVATVAETLAEDLRFLDDLGKKMQFRHSGQGIYTLSEPNGDQAMFCCTWEGKVYLIFDAKWHEYSSGAIAEAVLQPE